MSKPESRGSSRRAGGWILWGNVVFLVTVAAALFLRAMDRDLNHDEHQFLVPGVLLSSDGLLPYRDYPLFHLPNLVFAYAAVNKLVSQPIFGAKLLSVVSSAGIMLLLYLQALRTPAIAIGWRFLLAASVVALLFFDPLFLYTAGKTWNHEVPTFLVVSAILLQIGAFQRHSALLAALSGVACALAIGTRLTFLPIAVPLCCSTLIFPLSWKRRLALMAAWIGGASLAMLPSVYFFITNREAFLFGNFEFPRLRLLDPENTRIQKTMRLSAKLRYFFKDVVLPSWPLFIAFLAVGVRPAWQWVRDRRSGSFASALVLVTIPFAIAGCFAPSRYQYQHFFGVICLIGLGVALGARELVSQRPELAKRWVGVLAALGIVSAASALVFSPEKERLRLPLVGPAEWFPARAKAVGMEIRGHVPAGPVLTLAPAWPMAAGLSVYPEFATGPFAWRSGRFVSPERRKAMHLVAPEDLSAFLLQKPPAAVLTGVEDKELEEPLVAYVKEKGFRRIALRKKRILWLPPVPAGSVVP